MFPGSGQPFSVWPVCLRLEQTLVFAFIGRLEVDEPAFVVWALVDQFGVLRQFPVHRSHGPAQRGVYLGDRLG